MIVWHAAALACKGLAATPIRAVVVVFGLALAMGLPGMTVRTASHIEAVMVERAVRTPVLIAPRGSPFEVTLASLYFRGEAEPRVPFFVAAQAVTRGYGSAVPVLVGYRASGHPLVGTSADYFEARGLRPVQGRLPAVLGEVVVGAGLAAQAGIAVGDRLRSDRVRPYDLGTSQPVELRVVGVLGWSASPDDEVVHADLLTLRAIEGILHAHEPAGSEAAPGLGASVFLPVDLSPETLDRVHAHGALEELPVTAVLVFPPDDRRRDQALGDWADHPELQAVQPERVVSVLVELLVRVRDLLLAWSMIVSGCTLALIALVLALWRRLRERELALLRTLGASRSWIALLVAIEAGLLLGVALSLAAGFAWVAPVLLLGALG
ncbi:MAG: hypothetical protein EA397_15705 [Deltaproteobacteria bacterium]|nr:MAG: hypothetical protein EA397_15705 [Deltaproteobacteria bacterium]